MEELTLERWRRQSPITDPGDAAFLLDALPADLAELCRVIQGVLIHSDWIDAHRMPGPHPGPPSRETLPLSRRLKQIAGEAARPLDVARAANERAVGTCRGFAVMLCGTLRHRGVAARVRCGFAAYLTANPWEDHWLCEYWRPDERRWCRIDAQLDEVQRNHLAIGFDITDVPTDMFITAAEAWRRCRKADDDGTSYGQGNARGLWFVRVNAVRDHYALHGSETSEWDGWRQSIGRFEGVTGDDIAETDALLGQSGEASKVELVPPWKRSSV